MKWLFVSVKEMLEKQKKKHMGGRGNLQTRESKKQKAKSKKKRKAEERNEEKRIEEKRKGKERKDPTIRPGNANGDILLIYLLLLCITD